MKKIFVSVILSAFLGSFLFSQNSSPQIGGREVFRNEDVIFRQIDDHTWIGTGNEMYNESLYLVEGEKTAVLIDAGTNIRDLARIVSSITAKPVKLVATHVHPDHTGSSINTFPEIYINPADTGLIPLMMPDYKGRVRFLKDGEILDLGNRNLEVVFTPAHTPGSTTFIDTKTGYGFSGDSFGSGNLLLSMDFSTLIASCEKVAAAMDKYGVKSLYPGHYFGNNQETRMRISDMITLSRDVLSGKKKGEANPGGMLGLDQIITGYGVRINYSEKSLK